MFIFIIESDYEEGLSNQVVTRERSHHSFFSIRSTLLSLWFNHRLPPPHLSSRSPHPIRLSQKFEDISTNICEVKDHSSVFNQRIDRIIQNNKVKRSRERERERREKDSNSSYTSSMQRRLFRSRFCGAL